jgi:Domain of unknown function (DUF4271)
MRLLKVNLVFGMLCWLPMLAMAQKDSVSAKDSTPAKKIIAKVLPADSQFISPVKKDSLLARDSIRLRDSILLAGSDAPIHFSPYQRVLENPFLPMQAPANKWIIDFRKTSGKERLFYLIAGLLLLLALIRVAFPRYLKNLFVYFFRTSLRRKQTRDQLLQEQISSLLMNLMFFMITATFITLAVQNFKWVIGNFSRVWFGTVIFLMLLYLGKFIFLRFAGWVFNSREAARSYLFIVFMMNKMLGILLIPVLLLVAFSVQELVQAAFTVGWLLIIGVFVYRYLASFALFRNKIALNAFHFFIYLMAVEIIPLLLIYKLLMKNLAGFL